MSSKAGAKGKDSSMNKSTQKKSNKHAKASGGANAQVDPDVLYQQELNERYYINPLLHNQNTQEDLARVREKLVTLILATHENLYGGDLGNSHDGKDDNNSVKNKSFSSNVCNVDFNKPINAATFPAVQIYKLPYLLNACGLHLSNEQVNQITAMTTHKLLKSYLVTINNNTINSNESQNKDANSLQEWHKENRKVESIPTTDYIDLEKLVHIIHEIHMNGFFTYVPESPEPNNTKQDDNTVNDENKKKAKKTTNNQKSRKSLQKLEPEETACKEEKSLLLHMTDNTLQQVFEALWIATGKETRVPELSEIDKTPVRCIHKEAMRELFTHKPTNKVHKLVAVDKQINSTNEQSVNEVKEEGEQSKANLDSNNNNTDTNNNNNNNNSSKWSSVSSLLMNDKFSANVMTQEEVENFLFHCTDASGEWIYESAFLERLHDVQN